LFTAARWRRNVALLSFGRFSPARFSRTLIRCASLFAARAAIGTLNAIDIERQSAFRFARIDLNLTSSLHVGPARPEHFNALAASIPNDSFFRTVAHFGDFHPADAHLSSPFDILPVNAAVNDALAVHLIPARRTACANQSSRASLINDVSSNSRRANVTAVNKRPVMYGRDPSRRKPNSNRDAEVGIRR
jgi:hypothetical protein